MGADRVWGLCYRFLFKFPASYLGKSLYFTLSFANFISWYAFMAGSTALNLG